MTFNRADHLPGLLPHHVRELRASGLSDETIRAAGIYSEDNYAKLASILDWVKLPKRMAPAIVFPFVGPDGRNGYSRIKPDSPRVRAGSPIKYESPRAQPNQVYLPPGVADLLDKPDGRLLVTEGEKKSLKARQEGFATLGLVGVYGWKNGKSERLLPALERIAWQGRLVYIVFDSDVATNPNVQDAESRLAAHLQRRGAEVRVVRLPAGPPGEDSKPAKAGLDDYLVAHGPAALQRLLESAGEADPMRPIEIRADAGEIEYSTEAAAFLKASEIDGVPRMRWWRGAWWLWTSGQYVELSDDEARAACVHHLDKNYSRLSGAIVSNVLMHMQQQALLPSRSESPTWLRKPDGLDWEPGDVLGDVLATRNALVHLPTLVSGSDQHSLPATPRYFCTSATAADFAVDAPRPDTWLTFLSELWPDDAESIGALQEWCGYCLTPDTRQQKILLLVGPKRSGKGTIARVLRALVGPTNVAGPTLASMTTNFGLQSLLGKPLAIVSDARLSGRADQAVVVERLLTISGEDALDIDRKHKPPITCTLPTRLMLVSNELPRLADSSGALAGRMLLLRLVTSFYGCEDPDLTTRLLGELPGILLWAIAGWQRLRDRGRFVQPRSGRELVGELEDLSSPIGAFVRERCVVGRAYRVAVADLFGAWQHWCESKGWRSAGTEATFGRDLFAAVPEIRKSRPREEGRRVWRYEGIALSGG